MERPFTEIALVWVAMVAAACAARSGSALGWTSPPNVPPSDAAAYEGQVVRVAGTVATAAATEGRTVLTLAGTPEDHFRIVIAPPLIGPRPVELAARFRGRDIEAEGKIDDIGGPLEMLVGDPESIRVTDADATAADVPAAAPANVAAARPRRVEAAARAEPPLAAPPAPPSAAASAPEPRSRAIVEEPEAEPIEEPAALEESSEEAPALAAAAPEPPPPADTEAASTAAACERARQSWRAAASAARPALARLDRCLAAAEAPCRTEAEALRRALAEVAASEERLGWLCTGGR
jgi:hypothetical protein